MARVNVVVVSYNSRNELRACVAGLAPLDDVKVTVVDNASADDSPAVVEDLPVTVIRLPENRGFAYGCNVGWGASAASFVLFLNPDATLDGPSLHTLAAALVADERIGAAAPRIVGTDGSLEFSLRRFPRLRSTYAQALFLHRLFPNALWADESVRDPAEYARARSCEWVSGACILVRTEALEAIGGFDERFFMYSEDTDLCRSLLNEGYEVWYEPSAVCVHQGGRSAPRAELLPMLATSRLRYMRKHFSPLVASLQRLGLALGAMTHMLASRQGPAMRSGYRAALRVLASPQGAPSRPARSEQSDAA
jgi:N-acetylglucosaminyl-diphospho-decaprenol L-rhamnosyltransferase